MNLNSAKIPNLDASTNQWLNTCANQLAKATGATLVLLFGSLMRGKNQPDSDVDFCCVVPNGTDLKKASRAAQMAFLRRKRPMDFYLIEASKYASGETVLAREIKQNSIVLFS